MTTVHKNLTGADLHEPKGADTAVAGCVYVSDGLGSGSWVSASSVITNTAFSTGDAKLTYKTTADSGWVLLNDGTIGDASSGATTRANADTSALFTLLWNNTSLTVSGGRGASAAADFAAHKTIQLPIALGRALVISGAGSGLTSRALAATFGAEGSTLVAGNLPTHTSSGTNSISVTSSFSNIIIGTTTSSNAGGGVSAIQLSTALATSVSSSGSNSISVTYTNASPTAVSVMQPSTALNIMVKL